MWFWNVESLNFKYVLLKCGYREKSKSEAREFKTELSDSAKRVVTIFFNIFNKYFEAKPKQFL